MELEEIRVPKLLALLIENVISSNKAIVLTSYKLMSLNEEELKLIREDLHQTHVENMKIEHKLDSIENKTESIEGKLDFLDYPVKRKIATLETSLKNKDRQIARLKNAAKKKGKK